MNLLKKHFNAQITEIESKIPNISGFAINAAVTAVEIKLKKQIIIQKYQTLNLNILIQLMVMKLLNILFIIA